MAGPYCARCQTAVMLEQNGRDCSNCGTTLITPIAASQQKPPTPVTYTNGRKPTAPKPNAKPTKPTRKTPAKPAAAKK